MQTNDEVHVWRASLDLPASEVWNLEKTLTVDELARAERYHFQTDHDRFIVRRGLLRTILGRYLRVKADKLRFRYSPHGKPALAKEWGRDSIRFNLADSHGVALYAVTRYRELGVDLERINPDMVKEEIAEQFFSRSEVETLRALPESLQLEAFFSCWTRKEAYIKAKGGGLSIPLDQFEVSLAPGEPAALLSAKDDSQASSHWSLRALHIESGYAAALCVEGQSWRLRCWDWLEDFSKGLTGWGRC